MGLAQMTADDVILELRGKSSEDHAKFCEKILFGKERGDRRNVVLGCRVPELRKMAKKHAFSLSDGDLLRLLKSEYHDGRALALMIMVLRFQSGDEDGRRCVADMYLSHTAFINSWDLVDVSASHIVGAHFPKDGPIFEKLSDSDSLWENRIAVVATQAHIRCDNFETTLRLCRKFLHHGHHLIHKACGWMLREVGKRNEGLLVDFLRENHRSMPRIMLSYAKERLKNVQL
ncbi:MAG: DNA alkylation repair protein [Holosporaceae bacterium]|nr:DNA alkylation repair protein [Holosporaceae bacterium]